MNETIDHQYVEGRLSAYLDGELPAREREAVDRHLVGCQACQWQLETLRQTIQWMGELPAVPVPRAFTIPAPAQPVPRRGWNFVPLLQGATALVALVLVVVVAGDLFFTGFAPRAVPQSDYYLEGAPALPPATMAASAGDEAPMAEAEAVVEEAEAALAPDVMPTLESAPTQTEALDRERTAEKSQGPVSATEEPMMSAAAAPPPPPEGGGATVEVEAAEAPLAPQVAAPDAEAESAELAAAATPTAGAAVPKTGTVAAPESAEPAPSLMPTAVWTVTAVAEVEEAMPTGLGSGEEQPAGALLRPSVSWLRVIEVALLATLALILPVTIIAMIQRRKSP